MPKSTIKEIRLDLSKEDINLTKKIKEGTKTQSILKFSKNENIYYRDVTRYIKKYDIHIEKKYKTKDPNLKRLNLEKQDPQLTIELRDATKKQSIMQFAKKKNIYYRDLLAYIKKYNIDLVPETHTFEGKILIAQYIKKHPEKTYKEICETFNISEKLLTSIRKQFNIPNRKKNGQNKKYQKQKQKAIHLLKTTYNSNEEIAKQTGIGTTTIGLLRKEHKRELKKTQYTLSKVPTETINKIIEENPHFTMQQIADKLGWSRSQMSREIKKNKNINYTRKRAYNK